jgi:hypothetical protein
MPLGLKNNYTGTIPAFHQGLAILTNFTYRDKFFVSGQF